MKSIPTRRLDVNAATTTELSLQGQGCGRTRTDGVSEADGAKEGRQGRPARLLA